MVKLHNLFVIFELKLLERNYKHLDCSKYKLTLLFIYLSFNFFKEIASFSLFFITFILFAVHYLALSRYRAAAWARSRKYTCQPGILMALGPATIRAQDGCFNEAGSCCNGLQKRHFFQSTPLYYLQCIIPHWDNSSFT